MVENLFQVSPEDEAEARIEKSLRPQRFEEFIGQGRVVENLKLAIDAAKARGDVLDHVLLSGMPGLGKTTLATLIKGALGVEMHTTSGPVLERGRDILGILTGMQRGDVLFIDEIHRMSRDTEEYLYSAMEDFKVDLILDKGPDARTLRISTELFTLVGATTREGQLSEPFRSRFGIAEKLELYPASELSEIVGRSAALLGCSIGVEAALVLGSRCRGTPRYANRFLRRIRDVAQFRTGWTGEITLELTEEDVASGLGRLGVDGNGLDRVDRKVLEVLLVHDEPVGLKTLAVSVGEEERTIEDVYEPYLIQQGMLVRTPRGRRASARAAELYGGREARGFHQSELGLS